jgi:hypothetical protein
MGFQQYGIITSIFQSTLNRWQWGGIARPIQARAQWRFALLFVVGG